MTVEKLLEQRIKIRECCSRLFSSQNDWVFDEGTDRIYSKVALCDEDLQILSDGVGQIAYVGGIPKLREWDKHYSKDYEVSIMFHHSRPNRSYMREKEDAAN